MSNQNKTKPEIWRNRLNEQQSSGLSQVKYCTENGLSVKTFLYWKRKLKSIAAQSFVKVDGFPVRKIVIIHSDGVRVILEQEAPEQLAHALLSALRSN
jgi:hypothetical protein